MDDYNLANALLRWRVATLDKAGAWSGTASDLAREMDLLDAPPANHLTHWIRMCTPLLRKLDLSVSFVRRGHARRRFITLQRVDRPQTTDPRTVGWTRERCQQYTPGLHLPVGPVCHGCKTPAPAPA